MFEALPEAKPDAILGLMVAFREDLRENKLDLGVGVYKDPAGRTPVMKAIKQAEEQLVAREETKTYVAPTGNAGFCQSMLEQVFGADTDLTSIRAAQSVGGSGALRVLADLLHRTRPEARIHVSDPSWPNHGPLLSAAGFELKFYPYYDAARGGVDTDGMFETLGKAESGDIVVLHGCCHNPTGADLDIEAWQRVADLCKERSLFPLVDLAYQGFGDGLDADAAGVRLLAEELPELVVAASCSKNFGVYRERVGAAIVKAASPDLAARTLANLSTVIRANYSMPPNHGAAATGLVLADPELQNLWRDELEAMRTRMVRQRHAFADAMRKRTNSEHFDFIVRQKGMFSRLPLSREQIDTLREAHGVYIVGDGRINVAGLPETGMDELAQAIASVM